MKKLLFCLFALCVCLPAFAFAAENVYEMTDESGAVIMRRAGEIFAGDEYIAGDNTLYRVESVSGTRARAVRLGAEPSASRAAFALAEGDGDKLICIYHTHSDESYIEGDGSESLSEGAGIYDVGDALTEALEARGFTVEHSDETFLPHDAKAYERSRRTAEELAKQSPAAIFDVHRDGIPDESEYETEVEGEETSMVRLLVGRSNQNADQNRAFAKELKAVADEAYPGLVKDIFIGKGNYNQELYANSVLLEFGTHTLDKERALSATDYMADVISKTLGGESAEAAPANEGEQTKSAGKGILWVVIVAGLAACLYALAQSGSLQKLKDGLREMTGIRKK